MWRSLEELEPGAIEAFIEAEFPALRELARVNRRDLMRLMGASLALAGVAGCKAPTGKPLLSQPADAPGHVAGLPLWFATALDLDGYGRGVLVKSHDGRPIKVEGNPLHPASLGATDPIMQAEILSLYDPDRSALPWRGGEPAQWAEFRRFLVAERRALAQSGGAGFHILIGATSSPTTAALIERLRTLYPAMRFHTYSPVGDPAAPPPGFAEPVELVHDYAQAEAVLSLGADFMGPGPAQVRHARDWNGRRRVAREQGRDQYLCVAEPSPTVTGGQADDRLPLRPDGIEELARAVTAALGGGGEGPAAAIARRLTAAGSAALVVAGPDQSPAVHALAFEMNRRLGAVGTTVRPVAPVRLGVREGLEPLVTLAAAISERRVRGLAIIDCNPAYDSPAAELFEAALSRLPVSLHLGLHRDETARLCRWHVPKRHVLESWGDIRAFDGTASVQQPATVPLLPGVTAIELLAAIAGERPDGRALVRAQWNSIGEEQWLRVLEAGLVPDSGAEPAAAAPLPVPPPGPRRLPRTFALNLRPDARLWDGRYANNAWLQELPDPITKLVWGNAALIAPATAELLELETGDLVEIESGGRTVEAPVWVAPGQAPGAVTMMLGYGRPFAGRVGADVGVDAYRLRGGDGEARLRKLGGEGRLIQTGHHHPMADMNAVRVVEPGAERIAEAGVERPSLYPEFAGADQAWGMVIDLDACIGCGACTIACQAENNIPVVGPEEVERGREMHWIRIDRYFAGQPGAPDLHFQPVPCMHCEKAPCEVVCPVAATVHSSDGLNQMVYNRCIGTRTCSNNCPYKVRRFNWFDYHAEGAPTPAPVHNPHVLVRDRGVMEKCTYCVQRINGARAQATVEGRDLRAGDVATACQQVCPTNAIVFGDLNDPASPVARARASPRNYALLGGLNTQPRTTYLARVRGRKEEA